MNARTALLIAGLLASGPAFAEQFSTSRGVHQLPPVASLSTEDSARQAAQAAETMLGEMLLDVDASERERAALKAQVDAIAQKRKSEQSKVDELSSRFEELDRKYKADYAAFELGRTELDADAARQSAEAARLQLLPSAQRDQATVERLNKWADEINARRTALQRDGEALLQAHAQVEAARALPEAAKLEADAKLSALRDGVQGKLASHIAREPALYGQLKQAIVYMTAVRAAWASTRDLALPHSTALEQARRQLRAYDTRPRP